MLGALLCAWSLCAAAPGARAQGASVRLTVDRHLAVLGEPLVVTVEVAVEGRAEVDFIEPALRGFRVLGASLVSRNIEIINWQMRRRETRVYEVAPLQLGTLTLGPAGVRLARRVIQSNTVQLEVRPAGAGAPPSSASAAPPEGDAALGGAVVPRAGVFVAAQASLTRAYVGQQLVVTWRLYTQSDLLSFQIETRPTTDGFWSEDGGSPRRLEFERVALAGQAYAAALLQRTVLFPQRAGRLTIGPLEVQLQTADAVLDGALRRRADPLTIEVLPLPSEGRPAAFVPANVGRFALAALLDRDSVEVGQAVTLRLIARGSGNLQQLVLPALPALKGVRSFEPKRSDRLEANQAGLQGEKEVAYLLLPQEPGELRLPAMTLAFFDPEARAYREARSSPLRLRVTGSAVAAGLGSPSGVGASNVLGPDIRPPRPAETLRDRVPPAPFHGGYVSLALLPLLLLAAGWGTGRLRAARSAPTPRARERALRRRVRALLHQARAAVAHARPRAAISALLAAALHEQLDHQLGLRTAGLTREALCAALGARGAPAGLVEAVGTLLDHCDQARFAPGADPQWAAAEAIAAAEELLGRVAALASTKRDGGQEGSP
ncbi:MAG: protein BatD [Proteobacteria bacterium]|nr:protein BatD [Pseudomonadota bacterium]